MWPAVGYFATASAANAALLWLQTFDTKQKPSSVVLTYRFLQTCLLSLLFAISLAVALGPSVGYILRRKTLSRKEKILSWIKEQNVSQDGTVDKTTTNDNWRGIIGFFHPFCNAGGGGERVLWAAIKATHDQYPNAVCVVYTGDHDTTKTQILERVKSHFNIQLDTSRIFFLYLSQRKWVLASTWPRVTLLGQSLGSLILAADALALLVPDIFVDTMGYSFTFALAKWLFPRMPTGAYIHYPTISTDMLGSLDADEGQGLNAGAGRGTKGAIKKTYWKLFAKMYGWVGGFADVIVTNSSWTRQHIQSIWGPARGSKGKNTAVSVLFPPVAVEDLTKAITVDAASEEQRENILVYIAQFRPEKNHTMILQAFADLVHGDSKDDPAAKTAKLVLIGSVRDSDDAKRVYELRLLAHELNIKDTVEFVCDALWPDILQWLGKASIGVNGMWNEHFGIGVVEYQAAGLISIVNDSGGPKQDIVIEHDGGITGFHASTVKEYSAAFLKALKLSSEEKTAMRIRARSSSQRFGQELFDRGWQDVIGKLIALELNPASNAEEKDNAVWLAGAAYLFFIVFDIWKILRQK